MKKTLRTIILTAVFVLLGTTGVLAATTEYTSGYYTYTLDSDGNATITGYSGNEKDVSIPSTLDGYNVKTIDSTCFGSTIEECAFLETVSISEGITAINDSVFNGCMNLKTVNLPSTVTYIGLHAFYAAYNLEDINVAPDNSFFYSIDGVLFNKNKTLVLYPSGKPSDTYNVPNDIIKIKGEAFSDCQHLKKIIFSSTTNNFLFASCAAATVNPVEIYVNATDVDLASRCFKRLPEGSKIYVRNSTVAQKFCGNPSYSNTDDGFYTPSTTEIIDLSALSEEELAAVTIPATDLSFTDGKKEWNLTYDYDFEGNLNNCYTVTPADSTDAVTWTYEELDAVTGEPVTKPVEVADTGRFGVDKPCYIRMTATTSSGKSICMNVRYQADLNDCYIKFDDHTWSHVRYEDFCYTAYYTGQVLEPETSVALDMWKNDSFLTEGIDYTVSYKDTDNINAGTGTILITGIHNYKGVVEKAFTIRPRTLIQEDGRKLCSIDTDTQSFPYDGSEHHPTFTITYDLDGDDVEETTLVEGTDYDVSYPEDSTEPGEYTAEITFKGNYHGYVPYKANYYIEEVTIKDCDITLSDGLYTDDGKIRPYVTVKNGDVELTEGTDYIVSDIRFSSFSGRNGSLTIQGTGNYTGSVTEYFRATYASSMESDTYDYTGSEIRPEVTVTLNGTPLVCGTDYTVTYSSNIEPSVYAYAKVTLLGDHASMFQSASDCEIVESRLGMKFFIVKTEDDDDNQNPDDGGTTDPDNGNTDDNATQNPDDSGTDDNTTQTPDDNNTDDNATQNPDNDSQNPDSNTGTNKPPVVTPPTSQNSSDANDNSQNSTAISGDNQNVNGNAQQTTQAPKVKKASLQSVKSTAKKTMTVKWKKLSGVSGYQIQYSTRSNFKNAKIVTIKKAGTTTYKVKKLSSKKKYYVRVRAYKTVNGKKYYGSWSSKKSLKIK